MSYCRMGDNSDLYVYSDGKFYHCCGCELVAGPECGELSTLEELRDHLQAHRNAGHLVPQRAIDRVERELAEVTDFVDNWFYGTSGRPILFVRKLQELGLSVEQVASVLKTMDEICHECWDSERGCRCWDDE